MKRINVYEKTEYGCNEFKGWFNLDSAMELASYKWGSPYTNGKILFATAKKKLVVNSWSNTGKDNYRFAKNEKEIAEILSAGGYAGNEKKMTDILSQYEI